MAQHATEDFEYKDGGKTIHKRHWVDDETGEEWDTFDEVGGTSGPPAGGGKPANTSGYEGLAASLGIPAELISPIMDAISSGAGLERDKLDVLRKWYDSQDENAKEQIRIAWDNADLNWKKLDQDDAHFYAGLDAQLAGQVLNAPHGPADMWAYQARLKGLNESGMLGDTLKSAMEQTTGRSVADLASDTPLTNTEYAQALADQARGLPISAKAQDFMTRMGGGTSTPRTPRPGTTAPGTSGGMALADAIAQARKELGALDQGWLAASDQAIIDKVKSDPTVFTGNNPIRTAITGAVGSTAGSRPVTGTGARQAITPATRVGTTPKTAVKPPVPEQPIRTGQAFATAPTIYSSRTSGMAGPSAPGIGGAPAMDPRYAVANGFSGGGWGTSDNPVMRAALANNRFDPTQLASEGAWQQARNQYFTAHPGATEAEIDRYANSVAPYSSAPDMGDKNGTGYYLGEDNQYHRADNYQVSPMGSTIPSADQFHWSSDTGQWAQNSEQQVFDNTPPVDMGWDAAPVDWGDWSAPSQDNQDTHDTQDSQDNQDTQNWEENATGGVIDKPTVVGEAGPEWAIPTKMGVAIVPMNRPATGLVSDLQRLKGGRPVRRRGKYATGGLVTTNPQTQGDQRVHTMAGTGNGFLSLLAGGGYTPTQLSGISPVSGYQTSVQDWSHLAPTSRQAYLGLLGEIGGEMEPDFMQGLRRGAPVFSRAAQTRLT